MATHSISEPFYSLIGAQNNLRWWFVSCDGSSQDESRLFRGELTQNHNPLYKLVAGSTAVDFLPSTIGYPIVSDRLLNIFKDEEVTGYSPVKIKLLDKQGKELKDVYYALAIEGRAGRINAKKSGLKIEKYPSGDLIVKVKGIYFSESTWDGSDIFFLEDFFGLIVSKRVVQILESNKVSGWNATPTSKYRYP